MNRDHQIGLGLIGCGDFGRFCLEAFGRMESVRLAAVADVRAPAAEAIGKDFEVPGLDDPHALISRDDVDLVHIATPPSTHHDLAMAAIRAGKHVLCEKPLAMGTAQADQILAAAAESGVIAPVNFVLRYNAVTDLVETMLGAGVLGKVLAARLTNCAGDTKLSPQHWFWNKSVSGGIFIEHGVHFFDLYRHWLGQGHVISAHAETRENTIQEDRVLCTVRHDNGTLVSHYHGFDQVALMDRATHHLLCELGDIVVEGWIPMTLRIDAAVDDTGAEMLQTLCPDGTVEVLQEFSRHEGPVLGRGKVRSLTRRVRLSYTPNEDKHAIYAESARALLEDQIAYIRDHTHKRRVAETDGRDAVALAEAADRLAAEGAG